MKVTGTHPKTGVRIEVELVDGPPPTWKWTVIPPTESSITGQEPIKPDFKNKHEANIKAKAAARQAAQRWTNGEGRFYWTKGA